MTYREYRETQGIPSDAFMWCPDCGARTDLGDLDSDVCDLDDDDPIVCNARHDLGFDDWDLCGTEMTLARESTQVVAL